MLEQVCQLARNAGDAIMEVYDGNQPINVASKKDDSPVTAADIAAHKVIVSGLQALDPDTPILPKRTRRPGKCASTGSATGWSTRWTAPKSLLSVTANSPSISR